MLCETDTEISDNEEPRDRQSDSLATSSREAGSRYDTDWEPNNVPFTATPGSINGAAALDSDQPVDFMWSPNFKSFINPIQTFAWHASVAWAPSLQCLQSTKTSKIWHKIRGVRYDDIRS